MQDAPKNELIVGEKPILIDPPTPQINCPVYRLISQSPRVFAVAQSAEDKYCDVYIQDHYDLSKFNRVANIPLAHLDTIEYGRDETGLYFVKHKLLTE